MNAPASVFASKPRYEILDGLRGDAARTVIGGWCINPQQVYIGIARLLYPFFCGLLLSRLGWSIRLRGGFWWCALLVVVALGMPYIGEGPRSLANGLYGAGCILFLFPLIVLMGAGSRLGGRRGIALCDFLGQLSYPLYITHYPLVYMQMVWAREHADLPLSTHVCVGVSVYILALGVAYASLKLYDLPVREWLRKRFLAR